jgi:DNA (cytosine-5)-methyltransferase 1
MSYPVISLFSGAMGLDLGLEAAGLKVLVGHDNDPKCAKTASANGRTYLLGDIREHIAQDQSCDFLLRASGLRREEVFAVVGGPPCQPFSTAGRRQATNDPRGSLFMQFAHAVRMLRPRFFVMENVKGLLSTAIMHRPIAERGQGYLLEAERPGSVFAVIKQTFDELGYSIKYSVLDAVHYGVPQFRERLVIIGSRDHEGIFLPVPTRFQRHQDPALRWNTLRSAIGDLEQDPGPHAVFSLDRLRYLRMVPPGGHWRDLPLDVLPAAMGGAYKSGGGKVGFYRRLDYDQPSPTLVTSPVQKATTLCHPTYDRPLSVREYMRIQQFPDDWKIEGTLSDRYRQIGNAVPIGLGKAIGQMLVAAAEQSAEIKTKRLRGTSVHDRVVDMQNIAVRTTVAG